MPLDTTKAKSLVSGARQAYTRGPHTEFIQNLADALDEALKLVDEASLASQRAQNDVARIGRELDEEKTAYRKLREQAAHSEKMLLLLREVAKSPRGAQKKAAELLKEMGAEEAEEAEEAVEAAAPTVVE